MTKPDECVMSLARWMATNRWETLLESCKALHEEAAAEYARAVKAKQYADASIWLVRADSILYIREMLKTTREDCWWSDE